MSANHHDLEVERQQHAPAAELPTLAQHHAGGPCVNCGAIATGRFCASCGQTTHIHHSLPHLLEEAVHGLWHFDAKGWRTIPLLIAFPGELTRRYIDGQRARFISPLGLFLFMMFLMFFVFSMTSETVDFNTPPSKTTSKDIKTGLTDGLSTEVENSKLEVAQDQAALDNLKKEGKDTEAAQRTLEEALKEQKIRQENLERMSDIADQVNSTIKVMPGKDFKFDFHGKVPRIERALQHAKDNPELAFYKLKSNAYKFALLLVPLSLPFLWVIFLGKKNIGMFDHAVFTLYSLSFMALLISVLTILGYFDFEVAFAALFMLAPPVHMFRQLKGTYGLSNFGALWRTAFLGLVACVMIALFIVVVTALSIV
jgi:hypothetical protein